MMRNHTRLLMALALGSGVATTAVDETHAKSRPPGFYRPLPGWGIARPFLPLRPGPSARPMPMPSPRPPRIPPVIMPRR
jgi:hypothetical protein